MPTDKEIEEKWNDMPEHIKYEYGEIGKAVFYGLAKQYGFRKDK